MPVAALAGEPEQARAPRWGSRSVPGTRSRAPPDWAPELLREAAWILERAAALRLKVWTGWHQVQVPKQAAVGVPGQVAHSGLRWALAPRQTHALWPDKAPAPGAAAAQSSAAQARGRVSRPDPAAQEPAPAPHVMAPKEAALATGQEPLLMAAAELEQVPALVSQAVRSLQAPGWEKLQVGRHP